MNKEIQVGDYVRANDGYVNVVTKVNQYSVEVNGKDLFGDVLTIPNIEIVSFDSDIKKLIQEGDYVNGTEVISTDWYDDNGDYHEGLAFPMYDSDDLEVIANVMPLDGVKVKSLVTHEMLDKVTFKFGGEKE